jgi:hypothetical protein
MITITGLTQKQKALMDVMWTMQEMEQVQSFIRTLPKQDALDCLSLLDIAVQETQEHEYNGLEAYESLANAAIARARSL